MQLKHPIEELLGGRMSIQVDIVVDHVTSDDEVDHGHVRLLGFFLNAGPRSEYRIECADEGNGVMGHIGDIVGYFAG